MADIVKNMVAAVDSGSFTVPLLINGEEVRPQSTFDVTSPATGKVVHRCCSAADAEADKAVQAAADAFKTWRTTTPRTRRDLFLKAAQVMERRRDELAGYAMDETGCLRQWADFNLDVATDFIIDVAGRVATIEGNIPTTQDEGTGALVLREPFGVVLAIAPWNGPYILGTRSVAFPIAAGNTAVLKGSELSPRCMWAIASIFQEAGLPRGVLNFISTAPKDAAAVTQTLIAHPEIKKINFTGSTGVGRVIGRLAGENLKPVLLELGGKAPAIVWEDADLEKAADQCATGAFLNSGQICMATERVVVHRAVRAAFLDKLKAAIDDKWGGDAQLIHGPAADKTRKLLRDAVGQGATVLYGDVGAEQPNRARMVPVVLGDVGSHMDLYRTESFGPSLALFEVDTEEEALRIANDTEYGLTSAVFTEDLRRGLRLARGIESGAVHINDMTVHDESALPHGGAKASGYGRFNAAGLDEWTRTKTVTYKF